MDTGNELQGGGVRGGLGLDEHRPGGREGSEELRVARGNGTAVADEELAGGLGCAELASGDDDTGAQGAGKETDCWSCGHFVVLPIRIFWSFEDLSEETELEK